VGDVVDHEKSFSSELTKPPLKKLRASEGS
jgi:hypothetical protein